MFDADAADYEPRGFGRAASWLATHETAHAICARAVGATVSKVEIDPARASGACHFALAHHLQAEHAARCGWPPMSPKRG